MTSASRTTVEEFETWKKEQLAIHTAEAEFVACASRSDWGVGFECFESIQLTPSARYYIAWMDDQAVSVIWGGGSEKEVVLDFTSTAEELSNAQKIPVFETGY